MDHHLRIKVVVAESSSNDEATATARPFVAPPPPPFLFRESVFSRPILPATSSLLLPTPLPPPPPPKPPAGPERYRECLRNHAASLGAHVVDGCGEFMPWGPAEPLRCAACGCHRSFHRKEPEPLQLLLPTPKRKSKSKSKSSRESSSEEPNGKQKGPEKRFRSKFSGEQKGKMAAFAERVGWRLHKKDDAETEAFCREEVGVSRRVLKVWMHNNKHLNIQASKLRPDQEQEHIQQQYYQPQPADQALGEEEEEEEEQEQEEEEKKMKKMKKKKKKR